MKVTIGEVTIEGSVEELCRYFGVADKRELDEAIRKRAKEVSSTTEQSTRKTFTESKRK